MHQGGHSAVLNHVLLLKRCLTLRGGRSQRQHNRNGTTACEVQQTLHFDDQLAQPR
jgi:hypothetical protein